jgi:hypothetical protein
VLQVRIKHLLSGELLAAAEHMLLVRIKHSCLERQRQLKAKFIIEAVLIIGDDKDCKQIGFQV